MKLQLLGNIGFVSKSFSDNNIDYSVSIKNNQLIVIIGDTGHPIQQLPDTVDDNFKVWLMSKINGLVNNDDGERVIDVNKLVTRQVEKLSKKL